MMNLDAKIKSNINKRTKLHLSKLHLERLQVRLREGYIEKRKLEKVLKKEYQDVRKLERLSIGRLFKSILGNLNEQLEIERQEYLQAVLNYKERDKELKMMLYEKKVLSEKIKALPQLNKEYGNLLQLREDQIMSTTGKHKATLSTYSLQIDETIELKREIYEAKIVGTKIKVRLEKMIKELRASVNMGDWSSNTYVYRGSDKAYVQKAQNLFYQIKPLLSDFKTELEDIYKHRNIKLSGGINNIEEMAGMYYDNLISDWVIQKNIRNALSNIESLYDRIIRTLQSLESEERRADQSIEYIKARKKALILDELS